MKKLILPLLTLSLFSCGKPMNILDMRPIRLITDYYSTGEVLDYTYKYDDKGRLTHRYETQCKDHVVEETYEEFYEYDDHDNQTHDIFYMNGELTRDYTSTYTYTSDNLIETELDTGVDNDHDGEFTDKYVNTYDASNRLIKEEHYHDNTKESASLTLMDTYDYTYEGNYIEYSKMVHTEHINSNENKITTTIQELNDKGLLTTKTVYSGQRNDVDYISKTTYTYDEFECIHIKDYSKPGSTTSDRIVTTYTYYKHDPLKPSNVIEEGYKTIEDKDPQRTFLYNYTYDPSNHDRIKTMECKEKDSSAPSYLDTYYYPGEKQPSI